MTRKKTLVVGLLAVALAIGSTAVAVAGVTASGGTEEYCAELPDAIGLYPGNPVTRMGYRIGSIGAVESRGDHVEVTFSVESGQQFPADVSAVIRSKSILADRSLELVGTPSAGPSLEPGGCIPLSRGFTPKAISEVVSSAAEFIDVLAPSDGSDTVAGAVSSLARSLEGQGEHGRDLMLHAADAMQSPDKFIADVGSSISNMAPLTEDALANWDQITDLVAVLPTVAQSGIELWPGVIEVCQGIGWLVRTLEDIQTQYAGDIWPFVHGPVTDAIALSAGRTGDIAQLLEAVPSVEGVVVQQAGGAGLPHIDYALPQPNPAAMLTAALADGGTR